MGKNVCLLENYIIFRTVFGNICMRMEVQVAYDSAR